MPLVPSAESGLLCQGIPAPDENEFTLAEVAGHMVHAGSVTDKRLDLVADAGKWYRSRWISSGSQSMLEATKFLQGSGLPLPVKEQKRGLYLPSVAVDWKNKIRDAISHFGSHPGLGKAVYSVVPPSGNVSEGHSIKRQKRIPREIPEEPGTRPDVWLDHFSGPLDNGLTITATAWDKHSATLAISVTGPLTCGGSDKDGEFLSTILLYDVAQEEFTGLLRCPKQRGGYCLSFSSSAGVLAVGCERGVVIWDLENSCAAVARGMAVAAGTMPPGEITAELRAGIFQSYHNVTTDAEMNARKPPWFWIQFDANVTTVSFSNKTGRFLVFGSNEHASFSVADLTLPFAELAGKTLQTQCTRSYGGALSLSFSPDDSLLVYTSPHRSILVAYDTTTWKETCYHLPKPVCNPQWHPDGQLFFHLVGGSDVMCVSFSRKSSNDNNLDIDIPNDVTIVSAAVPTTSQTSSNIKIELVLCERIESYKGTNGIWVAKSRNKRDAKIQSIALDPTGQRLAVALCDGLIANYQIRQHDTQPNTLQMSVIGLARLHSSPSGLSLNISFANCVSTGAVLSVMWENGLLTFLPLRFSRERRMLQQGSYGTPSAIPVR